MNKNDNIKEIYFNKSSSNNDSNENIKSIIFNNENENNVLKFISGNQEIEIEETVAIHDENLLYKDDIVYLTEIENQLLSEYPVTKQSLKFIQKEVESVAKKIIEVKNIGVKINSMLEKDIEYPFINNVLHDIFQSNYIIPIILDKHKIYTKLKEEEHEIDDDTLNIYFTETLEDKNGILEENQRTQFITLKTILHEKKLNKLSFKSYLNQENDIIIPYVPQFNNPNNLNIGILKNPKNDTLVLRYYDLKNVYWNTYKLKNDYITTRDLYDETGKIKGLENELLVKGDEINIIGFMILGNTSNGNHLQKSFEKVGIITKIYNLKDFIIIECKNHGLKNEEVIYIEESNSFPRINNTYSKSITIIDENKIGIKSNIKFHSDGNYGILYSLSKLKFELYEIIKENNNIKFEFKESTYHDQDKNHNKIYFFNNISIHKNDYEDIIKTILPNLNEIIENKIELLQNVYTYDDVNSVLKSSYVDINNLHYEQISIIKNILFKNLQKIIQKKEIITNAKNTKNTKNIKFFNDLDYYLGDKFITNKNIEIVYGKYPYLNKTFDNLYLRLKWINIQKDNGKYYYLNYLFETYQNKNSNTIKKKWKI